MAGSKILQSNVHVWDIQEIDINLVRIANAFLWGKRLAIKARWLFLELE